MNILKINRVAIKSFIEKDDWIIFIAYDIRASQ